MPKVELERVRMLVGEPGASRKGRQKKIDGEPSGRGKFERAKFFEWRKSVGRGPM